MPTNPDPQLAIIGLGKMGRALLEGILSSSSLQPAQVIGYDAHPPTLESAAQLGIQLASSATQAASLSSIALLCVKPADLATLVADLAPISPPRLAISIAAGIPLSSLESGNSHRWIRAMPNTPALVGRGASAIARGTSATQADVDLARDMLASVGVVEEIPESLMDAVTGLSGSGPAYVYTVIEALADGGCLMGLPKATALRLAAQTVAGAAQMVLDTKLHPAALRDQVTSPGGTTIAGLAALESRALRSALIEAVQAAARRSSELADR